MTEKQSKYRYLKPESIAFLKHKSYLNKEESRELFNDFEHMQAELKRRVIQADINISLGETVINMQAEIEQKDTEIERLTKEWRYQGEQCTEAMRRMGIMERESRQQAEEIRKLQEIIESQDNVWMRNMQLAKELEEKLEENKRFSEVLEWYAGKESWDSLEEQGLFIGDGGERARNTLSSIGGKK